MILAFQIGAMYFYIRVDEQRNLFGSGPNTDFFFIPLKSFLSKRDLETYAEVERIVSACKSEKEVYDYIIGEFEKKGFKFHKFIKIEEYRKIVGEI